MSAPVSPAVAVHYHPIPDRLAPYIERAMTLDFVDAIGLRWHVVPSGCVAITVMLGDPAHGFDLETPGFESAMWGLLTRALGSWCERRCVVLNVALTPRAAMQLPMEGLEHGNGVWMPSRDFFRRHLTATLCRQVRDAPTLDAKMQALLRWIEQVLFDGRAAHGRRLALGEVATLIRGADTPTLADAARRVGVSARQFERDFQRFLGATPRRYAQVAKVQQMAQFVCRGHSLADTAAALGFADQAHMTRLVNDVAGMPPAQLMRRARASPFARATGTPRVLRVTHV